MKSSPDDEDRDDGRRRLECRCMQNGLVVYRFETTDPPPVWLVNDVVAIDEARTGFLRGVDPNELLPAAQVYFYCRGVEVDATGTWVRYETNRP